VNDHFGKARAHFGTKDTMDIARILAEAEGYQHIGPHSPGVVAEEQTTDVGPAGQASPARNRYNLTFLQRFVWGVGAAFLGMAFAGALFSGADAINRIFLGYGIDISDPPYKK